ncbi:MAG: CDP-alcohol phosphatidyltransferase family protein [Candidatus Margulisiibacteriota bacterium]
MKLQNPFRHVANIITLLRIVGVALIFWLTPYHTNFWLLNTALIYALICVTDFVDGWVARKFEIVSDLGKILDPLADKILVLVFLPLLEMQVISSFPVFIILAREFAIMALRVVSVQQGSDISAKLSGKIKTAITLPVCGILFARVDVKTVALPKILLPLEALRIWIHSWPWWVFAILIWATVLVTVWSFMDYFGRFIWDRYVKKAGGEEQAKRLLRSLIPNSFSMMNLVCGMVAVVMAWYGQYHTAVLLVILGILFDSVDGHLARKLDAFSKFGAKLDSKADFVSFGIAPAIVVFQSLANGSLERLVVGAVLGILYYGSVHYRLRRFDKTGHSDEFEGLPSPVGAAIVLLAAISRLFSGPILFVLVSVGTSLLMMSRIPYVHNIESKKTFLRYLRIPTILFLILTIMHLLDLHIARSIYAYEILLGLAGIYVLSPVFFAFKKANRQGQEK